MQRSDPLSRTSNVRYEPCALLRNHGIPSVIWFEDAIAAHGAPVALFDLYLLVSEIDPAHLCLQQYGWTRTFTQAKIGNATVNNEQCRLVFSSEISETDPSSIQASSKFSIVLLRARDWGFSFEDTSKTYTDPSTSPFPLLETILDGLIGSLLDCPVQNTLLQRHLACQVCYIYEYAPQTQLRSFAEKLRYEHRQYHHDVVSGMVNGTKSFIEHQRKIRDLLRQGTVEICDCSAPENRELHQSGGAGTKPLETIDEEGGELPTAPDRHVTNEMVKKLPSPVVMSRNRTDGASNETGGVLNTNAEVNSSQHELQRPTVAQIHAACAAVAQCLNQSAIYAILGGAACQLLGSCRMTDDIDVVVPQGAIAHARSRLALDRTNFTVEPRTRYTNFKCSPPIQIQLISPPGLFKEPFDADTATHSVLVNNVSVKLLHPGLIINSKCRSILLRVTTAKMTSDGADIIFLLQWIAEHQSFPTDLRIPNASESFIHWFSLRYGGEDDWNKAKWLGYC